MKQKVNIIEMYIVLFDCSETKNQVGGGDESNQAAGVSEAAVGDAAVVNKTVDATDVAAADRGTDDEIRSGEHRFGQVKIVILGFYHIYPVFSYNMTRQKYISRVVFEEPAYTGDQSSLVETPSGEILNSRRRGSYSGLSRASIGKKKQNQAQIKL